MFLSYILISWIYLPQLSQHNRELSDMLRPGGCDLFGDQALEYYHNHTAQIEVPKQMYFIVPVLFWGCFILQ